MKTWYSKQSNTRVIMEKEPALLQQLKMNSESVMYPFHMPGHKRQVLTELETDFPNPFSIDITEITGFDNLHHPEGILKESMEWAASVYGADKTYYLVNGSSSGLLSAVSALTSFGGTILISRNCHKSVYHGVILNQLHSKYVYPQYVEEYGVQCGLLAIEVERILSKNSNIQTVLVVSPTYEGIVSDIKAIARVVHSYGLALIVDEAHGAHFPFGENFPASALELGADIVVQSVHKTLPSLTQTALLHVNLKNGLVDLRRLEWFLQVYQSSSPSYVLMSSIENCIRVMNREGKKRMKEFSVRLDRLRKSLGAMRCLKLLELECLAAEPERCGVYALDPSKIVISTKGTDLNGEVLGRILRESYQLELELCGASHVVALTTLADTAAGMDRLEQALLEIDEKLYKKDFTAERGGNEILDEVLKPEICMDIFQGLNSPKKVISWKESIGRTSCEFVYLYPPGIPILVPGERITSEIVALVCRYKEQGLSVQGTRDGALEEIEVVYEG